MIYRDVSHEPQQPPSWIAWAASLALHLMLLALVCWQSGRRPPEAAAETPQRVAGIVLTQAPATALGEPVEASTSTPTSGQALVVERSAADDPPGEGPDRQPAVVEPASDEQANRSPLASGDPAPHAASAPAGKDTDAQAGPGGDRRATVRALLRGETTTEVFGVAGAGVKFVYLFDRSDSMHGPPLAAVKQQLIASIDSLRSVNQFFIFFFNHQVSAWDGGGGRVAFATDENKRAAARFVRGISATGGTYRWEALRRALALHPDVIFFLTDTDNQMPEQEVSKAVERAVRSGIVIACIEFGAGPGGRIDNFLQRLARETGGQYVYVDTTRLGR